MVTYIEEHVGSVSAVLILPDPTSFDPGTDYAFSVLSAILPQTLANNIAFMSTNVLTPSFRTLSLGAVPKALNGAPQFVFEDPIAVQNEYFRRQDHRGVIENRGTMTRMDVRVAHQPALEMLVKLFDWLDGLESQPVTQIVSLYEKYQIIEAKAANTVSQSQMDEAVVKKADIDRLMITLKKNLAVSHLPCLDLALESYARRI